MRPTIATFSIRSYVNGVPVQGTLARVTVVVGKEISVQIGTQHLCWPYSDFLGQLFRQSHVTFFKMHPTRTQVLTWDLFTGLKSSGIIGACRSAPCAMAS